MWVVPINEKNWKAIKDEKIFSNLSVGRFIGQVWTVRLWDFLRILKLLKLQPFVQSHEKIFFISLTEGFGLNQKTFFPQGFLNCAHLNIYVLP